jgi:large subunit ribosomal protein L40e
MLAKGIFDSLLFGFQLQEAERMPILDPLKKTLAQKHRLYMKICRDCGARNAESAVKCRKCRSRNLRWKKREIVK